MFIHTNQLNEGTGLQKTEASRRKLNEGNNPRTINNNWPSAGNQPHSNSSWQKLRK